MAISVRYEGAAGVAIATHGCMINPGFPEDEYERRRLADIRVEISTRLINATASMSEESRDELLTQMALMQWNAERRARVRVKKAPVKPAPDVIDPGGEPPLLDEVTEIE